MLFEQRLWGRAGRRDGDGDLPALAATVGRERHPFKIGVRKLKELGLTESLEVGYRLSPRGWALARLGPPAPSSGGGGSVPGS